MTSTAVAKELKLCPTCGSALLPQAAFGLCARCLLDLGFLSKLEGDASDGVSEEMNLSQPPDEFDYELLERIGRGGMGVVYRARQRSLNRIVALKMIAVGDSASPALLGRFRREAEMAAKLDHPNIVSIIEVGEFQANPFLVMRLVVGDDLAVRSAELALPAAASAAEARQCQARIVRLLATVARAVDFAHNRGVLHRDLKPSNILLDAANQPHLTDFGIAKSLDQETGLTQTAELLGTLSYMSPEQAAGKATARASDIYSLGAILYELLTRRRPFEGAKIEVLHHVLGSEPIPPRAHNPAIEVDLATICLKCLDKNPLRRYPSALALAEDLERWERREPVLAREAGPLIRAQRWASRNPALATLLATLSFGIVLSLTLLARANEEKSRKSIALDILRTESARQLQEIWSSSNAFFAIKSETLLAMAGKDVSSLAESENRFTIGLVAEGNPLGKALRAAPMLNQIESAMSELVETPTRFDLRLYKDPARAVDDLARGAVDFAQLNARQFVRARERSAGVKALLRLSPGADLEGAVIFTRRDSGIQSLSDLRGRSMLFGPVDSTMSFWAKSALVKAGVHGSSLGRFRFTDQEPDAAPANRSASASAKSAGQALNPPTPIEAVMAGNFDAAVARERRFQEVAAEQGLVALHRFADAGDLLAARGDMGQEIMSALRLAILKESSEASGPSFLGAARMQPATEDDYKGVVENLGAEAAFDQ